VSVIHVAGLGYRYPGAAEPAIEGLGFDVAPGEVFGFLGPSGAGKSTTQRILIGLLRGYAGQVEVFGRPPADWGGDYYERIGVAFELPNHFLKLSARENLRYFARLYQRETLDPVAVLAELGLEADADLRVGAFSKGMKVRLSLARALLHQPELLFLDEPTAGLDPVNARRVKDLIRRQSEGGKSVFLTTHDMAVADQLCDRVAFLVDGRIRALDSPRAFRLRHGAPRVRVEFRADGQLAAREFPLAGLADEAAFLDLLRGGQVQTLHSLEATLEDVFVAVTGRELGP
jgi:fluoroquinolone transport system ATP-binding protein